MHFFLVEALAGKQTEPIPITKFQELPVKGTEQFNAFFLIIHTEIILDNEKMPKEDYKECQEEFHGENAVPPLGRGAALQIQD